MPLWTDSNEFGNQLREIPSYYEMKSKEAIERDIKKDNDQKEAFLQALAFYNENYPKSMRKEPLEWIEKKDKLVFNKDISLKENLESFTKEQLYLMAFILEYNIKEKNYKKMATIETYQEIRGKAIKLIPGGKEAIRIQELQAQQQSTDNQIKELKRLKKEKEKAFEIETLKKKEEILLKAKEEAFKEVPKEDKTIIPIKEEFLCPFCKEGDKNFGKVYGNRGGLGSHVRFTHNESEMEAYKKMTNEELKKNETK